MNWNKFDRLLNRTRTDATVQAQDASPVDAVSEPGIAASTAASGAAASYTTETLRPAASLREETAQHVEVLRPKSVTSAQETETTTDAEGDVDHFAPEPVWTEEELAAQADVVISEEELLALQVYLVGAASIGRQENPRRLEIAINALLPPAKRIQYFD